MQRAVSSLPLSGAWLAKLASCGFESADDLREVGVVELSREVGVSHSEALEIIRVAKGVNRPPTNPHSSSSSSSQSPHPPSSSSHSTPHTSHDDKQSSSLTGHSALELLHQEKQQGSIVTFCARVDEMMGGGVALGKVTEFCGAPGLGKTQISMQLAVDVSIPELFGGVGGEAVYIDTEGSFIVERVAEVASAAVQHLSSMAEASSDEAMKRAASELSLETVLAGIHLYRCQDHLQLLATVNLLPDFIAQHPKVRLVVVDSIAAHFRHGFQDMSQRSRTLNILSQNLIRIATSHRIAVVLTNQMTTKVSRGRGRGERTSAQLVPALGESWGHASTVRVVLFWSGSERCATLYKSPTQRETTVPYSITADGIRDCHSATSSQELSSCADPSSQCLSLSAKFYEEWEEDEAEVSDTDDILANITDPSVWQGGGEGVRGEGVMGEGVRGEGVTGDHGGRVIGGVGGKMATDFVSVSRLHETTLVPERERRGRKRQHPSDPEL